MAAARIGLRLLSVTGIITFFFMRSHSCHYCSSVLGSLGLPQRIEFNQYDHNSPTMDKICLRFLFPFFFVLLETMAKICLRFLFHSLFHMDAFSGSTLIYPLQNCTGF
jgi:hypothetical protein